MNRQRIIKILGGLIGLFVLIQLVPYGRSHTNPPIVAEPDWDSPETRAAFMQSCGDCHSHETVWPWYSNIAPVSWVVQRDVDHGREHFNVSQWNEEQRHADEAAQLVREGEMPLWIYLPTHPEANLSSAEQEALIEGLVATFGERGSGSHSHDEDH